MEICIGFAVIAWGLYLVSFRSQKWSLCVFCFVYYGFFYGNYISLQANSYLNFHFSFHYFYIWFFTNFSVSYHYLNDQCLRSFYEEGFCCLWLEETQHWIGRPFRGLLEEERVIYLWFKRVSIRAKFNYYLFPTLMYYCNFQFIVLKLVFISCIVFV